MKTINGWAYPDADEFMASEMKADGTYQASHLRLAMNHVINRTMAIDGGAHVGTWSRLMSGLFERVLAIEPSEDTFEALQANMATFGCANVETRRCALAATAGAVEMAPLDPRAAAMKNTGARFVRAGGTIPAITIDSLNLPSLGFIKLDVEGSEPLALEGARETLLRCQPIVLFEMKGFARRFGLPPDAAQQVLASVGYHELQIAGCDRIWGPK